MSAEKIKFVIEGLNTDGEWVAIDRPLPVEGDHVAHMNHVAATLRDMRIGRYSRLRLQKYVTTEGTIGDEVIV